MERPRALVRAILGRVTAIPTNAPSAEQGLSLAHGAIARIQSLRPLFLLLMGATCRGWCSLPERYTDLRASSASWAQCTRSNLQFDRLVGIKGCRYYLNL